MLKLRAFIYLFVIALSNSFFSQSALFNHLTGDDGLCFNSISCLAQDQKGFIWIGTYAGLNKYDGYKVTQFVGVDTGTTRLRSGNIKCLFADKENNLWVGTDFGLSKFDQVSNKITTYLSDSSKKNTLCNNVINEICEYEDGKLYLATNKGLCIFDKKTNNFSTLLHSDKDQNSMLADYIRTMSKDLDGNIWLGHSGFGITKYIAAQKKFIRYSTSNAEIKLRGPKVRNILADSKGLIWISTWQSGLSLYDTKTKYSWEFTDTVSKYKRLKEIGLVSQFIEDKNSDIWMCTAEKGIVRYERKTGNLIFFENNPDDPQTISDNTNLTIMEDHNGLIWSGTWKAGVNYFNPNCLKFGHFKYESNKEKTLNDNMVLSLFEYSKDEALIGTAKSICKFNFNTKTFENVVLDPNDKNSLVSNSHVNYIFKDYDGTLWYGTDGNGLYHYFPKTNKYKHYNPSSDPNSLSSDFVGYMILDADSNLWICTNNGGLNLFNREKDNFTHFLGDKSDKELYSPTIMSLILDKKGKIWVGTDKNGLLLLNPKTKTIIKLFNKKSGSVLYDGTVFAMYFDAKVKLWLTGRNHFLELDPETYKYIDHTEKHHSLIGDFSGIVQDDENNFWLTSTLGLTRYNPISGNVKMFSPSDGTQGPEFNYHALIKLPNSKILAGGWNGFNYFDPKEIVEISNPPQVAFTELFVLNKLDSGAIHISRANEITLSYKDYFFALHFAALDFSDPLANKFKYKMDGLDENWIEIGQQHQVTFTNLDPGDYVLNIKGSNSQGVWNETPIQLKITITPPFWRTKWFYILCIIIIVASIYFYIKWREKKLVEEKQILEHKVEERTNELQEEKLKVEEAHKDIKDSIYYAQKIQSAIIPTEEDFKTILPNSFVLFQPKDIVSGDFYWIIQKNDHIFCAIADCTGHGVPGGFMTMLGSGLLNEVVNEQKVTEPAEILNKLREKIISTLKQKGKSGENKDGMDIVLLRFNKKTRELDYACANNGFMIMEDGKFTEYYGDKQPVGIYGDEIKPFTAHTLSLPQNVTLYSYTDGYPDQFGGEKGKKFKYKALNELLIKNTHLQMVFQKDKLADAFKEWKGDLEQVDDVCVMGIRF